MTDPDPTDRFTRRDYVKYGSALVAGGLLAGCSGQSGGDDPTETDTSGESTPESTATGTATPEDTSYTVTMAPAGDVTFQEVPETFSVYESGYADMAVALGKGEDLLAVGNAARFYTDHYDELDGVSVAAEPTQLLGDSFAVDRELFYELDSDVHLIDPQWLVNNGFGLEQSDVDGVAEDVGPFVANTIFRRTDGWHEYRYYTLYEAFEKVAQVFRREDRYEAVKAVHDDAVATVSASLPSADDRPNALLCFGAGDDPERFYPYRLSDRGTNKKQFRDLGIADALSGSGVSGLSTNERGQIDYETMLSVDPDSILLRGHEAKTEAEFRDTVVSFMEDHEVASELTAVQEGRVFRGGPIYQGPIQHLFNLERFATLYFPERFSGELFSRAELSAAIRGDV
ncbi:ABC transporter substrate-binding protein [Halobaculum sp. CBA1158]|uniref:ABC transporter substrate-binding protein n=1 Tax=Halobaculum sp. CBA1158 TaxID=2904243 RepID=UPI001F31555F|nr:ABC transporter substrate-binding protein [Halobaculum sp. CBA1158]UIO98476.1 ABC transporter substrate-binding protein [Halobaculum sp. CBA1158]